MKNVILWCIYINNVVVYKQRCFLLALLRDLHFAVNNLKVLNVAKKKYYLMPNSCRCQQ